MTTYTTPRKSLRLRNNAPSPFLSNRKRELFPVDNWDEDSHDIAPLQSSPEAYDTGLASPESPINMNHTPITELSPTMSDKFERLMSDPKTGSLDSATMIIEETPHSRCFKQMNKTPFESETNKEAKTPSKKGFSLSKINSFKIDIGVRTTSFYGGNQISLEDLRLKRFNRLHSNPKVKAKLFNDSKSTSKKRPRSSSHERKSKKSCTAPKTDLFPGIMLPFKKKTIPKKLFIKTEVKEEKVNTEEESDIELKKKNFEFPKPSSLKKDVWAECMKSEKPERMTIEQPESRKFFKSTVIQSDTPSRKENSFNYKVVNWGDENKMSTIIKNEQPDFDKVDILDDDAIEQIGQEVSDLIELLDDEEEDSQPTAIRYPGLTLNSLKREPEEYDASECFKTSNKRIKTDEETQNHVLKCEMPDLIKDAYSFDESQEVQENPFSKYTPSTIKLKDISNLIKTEDESMNESQSNINNSIVNENISPQTKLFSIFTTKTPSPNRYTSLPTSGKSTVRRVKRIVDAAQYQIDAGQKKFGGFLCKECGLYYSRGEPEDESEHDKYHAAKNIFKYNGFKNEKVVYQDDDERIIVISGSDSKMLCAKALEVVSFVDQELGFNSQNTVLPITKKVYLYIRNKQVVGCLVVELISQAYRNLETETEDMVIVTEESYPAKVGVNRVWTKWDCRQNGIASKLLDSFRKNYTYGHILSVDEIAFTVPTRAGKQFIKKYTNRIDYNVYTGW
ncbi:N-acetyltransferase ESCO1 [Adelges cooleyi]|uniref:N-acetyltransferase ESCO1 n=1 Tax=Adelges cooleyi TaxID=133065 RepID=UPI00217F63C2|nr:N-acetyltransferase ESCO1 [Adelges cooleyi]XP_050434388.1 N-acetyltransferase ESCO1 [Adelges cooleyi]XP_050434389.1 N-acetyltransferase ESCO1 [Adelges cooleyi]XP_050434390.1 N-acetyltransferase ESCO1 [Adelges cooleyi]